MSLKKKINNLKVVHPGIVPSWGREFFLKLRQFNAAKRALPDFLVIGAQKSGSTSLFNYLALHPNIIPSIQKEIFYFSKKYSKGKNWYRRYFPLAKELQRASAITGEGSTMYLSSPEAAKRAAADIPKAKWIAVLRHPGYRAISHFYHRRRTGLETRQVTEVFSESNLELWRNNQPLAEKDALYFERGDYTDQIKIWREYFPLENGLVIFAESMFGDLKGSMMQVHKFLGLIHQPPEVNRSFNQGTYERKEVAQLANRINQTFEERNRNLSDLLKMKTPW